MVTTHGSGVGWLSVVAVLILLVATIALSWMMSRRSANRRTILVVFGMALALVMALFLIDRRIPPSVGDVVLSIGVWLIIMAISSVKLWSDDRSRQLRDR